MTGVREVIRMATINVVCGFCVLLFCTIIFVACLLFVDVMIVRGVRSHRHQSCSTWRSAYK